MPFCIEQCRDSYTIVCYKCSITTILILLIDCWSCVFVPKPSLVFTPAQEWCTITIQSSGYLGGDCTSANLLKFEQTSNSTILILGGWQRNDGVLNDIWLGTDISITSASQIWRFDRKDPNNVS